MDVSVVMPAYNEARFIGEAIESVLHQHTDANIELIVVDDGSTDETVQVARRIGDPRVVVLTAARGGVSSARNLALERAKGRYIAFLDADDRWLPSCLDAHLSVLEADPSVGFVFSDFSRFRGGRTFEVTHFSFIPSLGKLDASAATGGNGRVIEGDTFVALIGLEIFPTWLQATLIRSSVLNGLRFPTGLALAEDVVFMNSVYLRARGAYTTKVVAELRRHDSNATRDPFVTQEGYLNALLVTRETTNLTTMQAAALDRKIGGTIAGLGHHYFHSGRPIKSLSHYMNALAYRGARWTALKHIVALPISPLLRTHSTGSE